MQKRAAAFGLLVAILAILLASCGSSDSDDETLGLPPGYLPADATFRYATRFGAAGGRILIIRLSKVSMCQKASVPDGHPFVSIELLLPAGQSALQSGTYAVDGRTTAIIVEKTHGAACSGASGAGANSGTITIEASPDHFRGSFVGKNPDSRVDVEGTFEAQPCFGDPEQYCL